MTLWCVQVSYKQCVEIIDRLWSNRPGQDGGLEKDGAFMDNVYSYFARLAHTREGLV